MSNCQLKIIVDCEQSLNNKENFDPIVGAYTAVHPFPTNRYTREVLRDITKALVRDGGPNRGGTLLAINAKGGAKISAKLR
jgi:hypothetical protein